MKKFVSIFLLLFTTFSTTFALTPAPITVNCIFQGDTENFPPVGKIYWCKVNITATPNVTQPTVIQEITGIHGKSRQNSDVEGFAILNGTFNFFPSKLENFFTNLTVLVIRNSSLLQINREDLAPFPKLRHLNLSRNKIQILEKNLFQNQNELKYLWLYGNRIEFVDSRVFENLKKVNYFNFNANPKFKKENVKIEGNLAAAQKSLVRVTEKCFDLKFLSDKDARIKTEVDKWQENLERCRNETKEAENLGIQLNLTLNQEIEGILKEKNATSVKLAEIIEEKNKCEAKKVKNDAEQLIKDAEIEKMRQNLTKTIFELEIVNFQLESNFTECEAERSDIEAEKSEIEAENQALENKIQTLEVKLQTMEAENVNKSRKIENMQQNLEENSKIIQNLTEIISTLEEKMQNEFQRHLQKEKDQNQEILDLNSKITNLEAQMNETSIEKQEKLENSQNLLENCQISLNNSSQNSTNCHFELHQCQIALIDEKLLSKNFAAEKDEIIANFTQIKQNFTKTADKITKLERKNREQAENVTSLLTQLDKQKSDVATSSLDFYIAIGFVALLCVVNVLAFSVIYCRKRSYGVYKMDGVRCHAERSGMGQSEGISNPVFDNETVGDIVEVDSSLAGLSERRRRDEISAF